MKQFSVLLLGMICLTLTTRSQTDEFKPGGKPFMKIFSNYHTKVYDGESVSAFEIRRVYLGYVYAFSENLSMKANFDIGDPGVGKFQLSAYVKNAYASYKTEKFTVNFGMIPTTQLKLVEDYWGYRYLHRSFQDSYKMYETADMGFSFAYKLSNFISADLIITNGEGYKKMQADSAFRTGASVTVLPVKNLTARVMYDFSSKTTTQSTLATFVGYTNNHFSVGAEYNKQFNHQFGNGQDLYGTSFYTTINIVKNLNFFGRYDHVTSNTLNGETTEWNHSKSGELYIAGLEFSPFKGVKIAPNFQGWNPVDDSQEFSATYILNCEFKF